MPNVSLFIVGRSTMLLFNPGILSPFSALYLMIPFSSTMLVVMGVEYCSKGSQPIDLNGYFELFAVFITISLGVAETGYCSFPK